MDAEQKSKLDYLEKALTVKEKFAVNDFKRKEELMKLRQKLSVENVLLRDKVAEKRHSERVEILTMK